MTALALDASGSWLSLALERDGKLHERNINAPARQNEILMQAINELLDEADAAKAEIRFVSCTSGPGSFTGLRIALSVAKGIALARGIPLYTENTLYCQADAAMAGMDSDAGEREKAPDGTRATATTPILSLQDARKGNFFALLIHEGRELMERGIYSATQLYTHCEKWPHIRVCGDVPAVFKSENRANSTKFSVVPAFERGFAKELLQRVRLRYTIEPQGDSLDCGLDYMKKSEAEENLNARTTQTAP